MANNDWLDGYTLAELLGAAPVSKTKKQLKAEKKHAKKMSGKRGVVSATLGAPFRLAIGLVKLPVRLVSKLVSGIGRGAAEIVKLPVRVLGAIARPKPTNPRLK